MSSRGSSPTRRLFGTDGMRGAFGRPPLDEATVRGLATALAGELRESPDGAASRIVLGGDTRDSTPVLCRWLTEELENCDIESTYLGVVPTPCVAFATRTTDAACGVAVSASHNPHPDNGIKLIDSDGFKWSTAAELRLEQRLQPGPVHGAVAGIEVEPDRELVAAYQSSLVASVVRDDDPRPLDGLAVALDAGNGAASPFARRLFEQLGARVSIVHADPDGRNINQGCGSTHPGVVAELVRSTGADLGFSFDGLLTALQIAGLRRREGRPLSAMLEGFERFPQLLKNLPVRHKPDLDSLPNVVAARTEVERKLGSEGRLVLRYSGTEPLVRIMLEGPTREAIEALADELAAVLEEELG